MSFAKQKEQTKQVSIRRLVSSVIRVTVIWLLATALLFVLLEILPGDAASNQAGKSGEEAVLLLRHKMGLDQPIFIRYLQWLGGLFSGNLGSSYVGEKPVLDIVQMPVMSSLTVAGIVFTALIFLTLPLAVVCGYYRNAWTRALNRLNVILASIPEFILAILILILFALKLRLLSVLSLPGPGESVWTKPVSLVMPSLCLWLICSVSMFRHLRVMIEDYAQAAYVREARLSGLSESRVLFVHLLPSALGGIAQMLASSIPYLLGGSMIVETLTSFPGMGYTLVTAVQNRETLIVMALGGLLIAISIIFYHFADRFGRLGSMKGGRSD